MSLRRPLLISTLLIAGAAAGGHYYLWQQQAKHFSKTAEQTVQQLAAQGVAISYDAMRISGYPLAVELVLENPRASGRIDSLLEKFAPAEAAASGGAMPQWQHESRLSGELKLRSNLLADRFTATLSGAITSMNDIGGQKDSSISKPSGDSTCDLALKHAQPLASSLLLMARSEALPAPAFESIRCEFPASSYSDTNSGEMLSAFQGLSLRAQTSLSDNAARDIDVFFNVKEAEVSKAGDKLVDLYLRALAPQSTYSAGWSAYGKQTTTIDFSARGLREKHSLKDPFTIDLRQFQMHNDAYDITISAAISHSLENSAQNSRLMLNANSRFTPAYQAMLDEAMREVARGMLQQSTPTDNLSQIDEASLYDMLRLAVPDLASLGTLTQAIDVSYQGKEGWMDGTAKLARFELSATPYGITGTGEGTTAPGQMAPVGSLTLDCRQCHQLIDDAAAYSMRLSGVLALLEPGAAPLPTLSPKQLEGLKAFLAALAPAEQDGLQRFLITSNQQGMPSINGKNMMDVLALYASHMQQQETP